MKYLVWLGILLMAVSVPVQAEIVQTVNFNPARLGMYERVAVSNRAIFKGGLLARSMQVRTTPDGVVSINENDDQFAYDITTLNAKNGAMEYTGGNFPNNPTLDFRNMCFSAFTDCTNRAGASYGTLNLNFSNGGAAKFSPTYLTYNDTVISRIGRITTAVDTLRIESVYAKINGKLEVTGSSPRYSYKNASKGSTALRLGGNWIVNPSSANPSGSLVWETRKTVQKSGSGGQSVKVLALK